MEGEFQSLMHPRGRALWYGAGPLLLHYALRGCPVDCGRPWSQDEVEAAVKRGPHKSAREPGAAKQFRIEAQEKQRQGMCRIVKWRDIRENMPSELKVSPLAAVPHKSRKWRAILDLSFQVKVEVSGGWILSSSISLYVMMQLVLLSVKFL